MATSSNLLPATEVTFTVGQLAKQFGVSTRTLRYYEEAGLLMPIRNATSRYRLYDGHATKRIKAILALQGLGYTLADIADMLINPPTEGKASTIAASKTRLTKQQATLSEKLVVLTEVKSNVDNKLAILDSVCAPCLDANPDTACATNCEHHYVHED